MWDFCFIQMSSSESSSLISFSSFTFPGAPYRNLLVFSLASLPFLSYHNNNKNWTANVIFPSQDSPANKCREARRRSIAYTLELHSQIYLHSIHIHFRGYPDAWDYLAIEMEIYRQCQSTAVRVFVM